MPASPLDAPNLGSLQKRAKDLLALARDPSEQARVTLTSSLYELYRSSAELPERDRALAIDVLMEIIRRAATGVRQQLAEQVSRDPLAPRSLVLTLARDEISVAFPVLLESPVLEEADLLDVLRTSPPEHRLGTLQREEVSETVAAAATDTRDPQLMRWLVENPKAQIPRSAMEVIVETARVEPSLQRSVIERDDMPRDLAVKIREFVPEELRQLADRRASRSAEPLPTPSSVPSPEADRRLLAFARQLQGTGALTEDLLVKTVRGGNMSEFEAFFARFSHIALAAARQILASPAGEALAVALKAQGMTKGTFATVFILTRKAHDQVTDLSTALARATDVFDKLSVSEAASRFAALRSAHPEDPLE